MLSSQVSSRAAEGAGCCQLAGLHREGSGRRARRYPSDTSDAQWAVIEPLLPAPAGLAGAGGRREAHCRREIVDAVFYVVDNGCKWAALPADFPPWQTVYARFACWAAAGADRDLLDGLRDRARIGEGRRACPSAGVIDAQSVRAAETVGAGTRGYDGAKRVNGRKRHIAVDTLGLLLMVSVTAASTQDRDGAAPLLAALADGFARLRLVFADTAYHGKLSYWAETVLGLPLRIIRRPREATGFHVLPRRWVVERTLAWLTRHRRLARDHERLPAHHESLVRWAAIRTTSKRLATQQPGKT